MAEEHAPLRKFFIQGYDSDAQEYPIVGVNMDPREPGYAVPADLDPCPDPRYPDHVFYSVQPTSTDQRVQWSYSIFPGPWSTSTRQDYDGETLTTKTRRNIAANITTQETLVSTLWTRTYQQQQNDDLIATEVQEFRTVPGNYVPTTRYDLVFGPIAGTRRLVANSGLTTTLTATVKRTYQAHENSDLVVWELIETNSDGTGSGSNPAYPIQINDFYDNERGAVDQRTQLTSDITTAGSLTIVDTTVTDIRYEAVDQFHRKKITETWEVPAPTRTADEYDLQRGAIETTLQIIAGSSVAGTLTASGNVVTETTYRPLNAVLLEKKVQTFAYPGPELVTEPDIDRDGAVFTVKRQLNLASAITEGEDNGGGTLLTIITSEPYSGQATGPLRWKITKTRSLPGTAWVRADVDGETGTPVSITMQIIATPSFPLAQTDGSEIAYQPITSVHGTKITTALTSYASVTVVDYPTGKMTAPPLITAATASLQTARDGTPALSIVWAKRAAKTREVKMTRTRSYGSQANMLTAQNALTLENPGVIDLIRDPLFFPAIREMNVLTDAVTLGPYSTGTENPKWPYMTETVSWTATTPSGTTYPGRTVVLSAVVEYWKYNLWRLTKVEATTF